MWKGNENYLIRWNPAVYVIACYESVYSIKINLCKHLWLRQSSFFTAVNSRVKNVIWPSISVSDVFGMLETLSLRNIKATTFLSGFFCPNFHILCDTFLYINKPFGIDICYRISFDFIALFGIFNIDYISHFIHIYLHTRFMSGIPLDIVVGFGIFV